MPKWNFVAMGQVGLTGWTRVAAQPVARAIARRTGAPEAAATRRDRKTLPRRVRGLPTTQVVTEERASPSG